MPSEIEIENTSFEVEKVIGSRKYKGKQQYLIKWMGQPNEENSWVDYKNMNCEKLVKEFEDRKKKKMRGKNDNIVRNEQVIKDYKTKNNVVKDVFKDANVKNNKNDRDKGNNAKDIKPCNELQLQDTKKNMLSVKKDKVTNFTSTNSTLTDIQKKYNLPPTRNIPNTYDSVIEKVENITSKNNRKIALVKYVDGSRGEIDLEIAKIGLPLHLIEYYESL